MDSFRRERPSMLLSVLTVVSRKRFKSQESLEREFRKVLRYVHFEVSSFRTVAAWGFSRWQHQHHADTCRTSRLFLQSWIDRRASRGLVRVCGVVGANRLLRDEALGIEGTVAAGRDREKRGATDELSR